MATTGEVEPQIQVRFHTRHAKYSVTDAAILVPTKLRRYGLSEIINHLLALDRPVPFDFLIDGQFLRTSIQTYLDDNGRSSEQVVDIEYVESALPPQQSAALKHDDWISIVRGHRQHPLILSGSYDNTARIWDRSGNCVGSLAGHDAAVKALSWLASEDGDILQCFTGSQDERVIAWNISTLDFSSESLYECVGHKGSIEGIAVNTAATHMATASYDSTIKIWTVDADDIEEDDTQREDAPKRRKTNVPKMAVKLASETLEGHQGAVSSVVFHQETGSQILYSGGWDHSVRLWDVSVGSNISTMNCERVITSIDHSAQSELLVTGHADPLIRLWDPRSREGMVVKLRLGGHANWVSSVAWAPNSLYNLVSGSYDGTVKVWDIRSTTPLYTLSGSSEPEQKVFGVDWVGNLILSGGEDTLLRIHQAKQL
ncbi:WD40-repeat-containing domain protein [Polychytrium aggregatum]|uniref:WD40-repeat-containing domain protein n=1 Tax=Polychytrium aggregatum TaxID=110093 RepID=UPI0022FDCC37|nr:WD40-repeat-containing domain protein [Polychytrium aggregatum]KAI9205525.1 WD40-repeat-containing domain protein [Polychytrium aggregatum]